MWHLSYIFWRCCHFCCGSLVLEVIPDLRSIGVWCCSVYQNKKKWGICQCENFNCQSCVYRESQRQTPMDLKSGITSKTKLLQKNWTHLQNLCIKVDQIAYAKSLEIFMRQELSYNFDYTHEIDLIIPQLSGNTFFELLLYFND